MCLLSLQLYSPLISDSSFLSDKLTGQSLSQSLFCPFHFITCQVLLLGTCTICLFLFIPIAPILIPTVSFLFFLDYGHQTRLFDNYLFVCQPSPYVSPNALMSSCDLVLPSSKLNLCPHCCEDSNTSWLISSLVIFSKTPFSPV